MKKFLPFLTLAALITLGSNAFAQSAAASGSATIVTPISATATAPLAFGTITKGATATVAATSSSAAAVTFSGDAEDNITITVPGTATIATTSGSGASMTVTIARSTLRVGTKGPSQATSTVLNASSGTATTPLSDDDNGDAVNNDGLGQAYIWIGGSVAPVATQQRGTYTGTFTVSAAYSN